MDFDTYVQILLQANGVGGAGEIQFVIADGMGFGDEAVWWPSVWQKRPVPHEGVDLVHYKTSANEVRAVWCGFRVVSPVSGRVVAICRDFLDETIWLNPDNQPDVLVALGHVASQIVVGQRLTCGDLLGQINYDACNVPSHLHLSVLVGAWRSIPCFDWQGLHDQVWAHFVDPCL